jgi:hypothetical protein
MAPFISIARCLASATVIKGQSGLNVMRRRRRLMRC